MLPVHDLLEPLEPINPRRTIISVSIFRELAKESPAISLLVLSTIAVARETVGRDITQMTFETLILANDRTMHVG